MPPAWPIRSLRRTPGARQSSTSTAVCAKATTPSAYIGGSRAPASPVSRTATTSPASDNARASSQGANLPHVDYETSVQSPAVTLVTFHPRSRNRELHAEDVLLFASAPAPGGRRQGYSSRRIRRSCCWHGIRHTIPGRRTERRPGPFDRALDKLRARGVHDQPLQALPLPGHPLRQACSQLSRSG